MPVTIATWDLVIVIIYLVVVMVFGIWIGRNQRDARDYFLCDHNLPWWAILGSIVATETSTATFLSVPGLAYDARQGDMRFLQLAMGYVIGRVLVAVLLLPHYFQGELFTTYQLLNNRFGASAKVITSILFMVTRTLADGLRLYLGAIMLEQVTHASISFCILAIGILTIIYTVVGGLRSVVWNDCVQLVVYMLGAIAAAVVIVMRLPGGWGQVVDFGVAHDKFRIFDFSTDPAVTYTLWSGILGGALLTMATHGSDQMMVQRVLSARNLREGSIAMITSGITVFVQFILFLLLGVALAAFFHQFPPEVMPSNDEAFAYFIAVQLPVGIRGLTLAAVLAAAMSTLSSSLNSSASAAYNDLIRPLRPGGQIGEGDLSLSRVLTIAFGIAQIAVGLVAASIRASLTGNNAGTIVNDVLAIASFTSGVVLGVFLLGMFTKHVHQTGALIGLVAGLGTMTWIRFGTDIAWTWYAVIGPLVTVSMGLIVSWWLRRPGVTTAVLSLFMATMVQADSLPIVDPATIGLNASRLKMIETIVQDGIRAGEMPGCVVLIGRHGKIGYLNAFGDRQTEPTAEPMTDDTLFDLASITKPVATATGVMILVDRGSIALDAPVSRYLPEFTGEGKETITVHQLLLHTGGLIPDNALSDYQDGPDKAWERICALELTAPPGTKFIYTDVGFITLGKLIERVSGQSLADFTRDEIFVPLGMADTQYVPAAPLRQRAAATEKEQEEWLKGVVHDPRARAMHGVAGHAGLFSTARDLAAYAQMMLQKGEFAGKRILSEDVVEAMTRAHDVGGSVRGLGWDKRSTYSSNRGDLLSNHAFGHGGFTGTVLWVDPELDLFYVFLSTRLHPDGVGTINPLAGRIGTIAAAAILEDPLDRPAPKSQESERGTSPVRTGIDVLRDDGFRTLAGSRIGLITNHTGVDRDGVTTSQLLHRADNVNLVAIFSPEHGPQGRLDVSNIPDSKDPETGLPIYSLYGEQRRPTESSLRDLDTLVFDIQDIGARYYTYISTMGMAMQAAAEHGKRFVVLDRPNPIGGVVCEGPVQDDDQRSFVAYHAMPIRHGMTVGELARMFQEELNLTLDLQVIPMVGWSRGDYFDRTELTWIHPSPNMRSLTQALLYPGIGWMETTNLSVGRGTDTPFEVLGAPWLDGPRLARALNRSSLPGVRFLPIRYTPRESKFAGEACGGIQIIVTDRDGFEPVRTGLTIAHFLRKHHLSAWQTDTLMRLMGNRQVLAALSDGTPPDAILAMIEPDVEAFRHRREKYLLYR